MKVVNESLRKTFRQRQQCEYCGRRTPGGCDPHHWYAKGLGGGSTLDVRINLIALCRWCHQAAHDGNLTKNGPEADKRALLEVIARREGRTADGIWGEICLLLRTPRTYGDTAPMKLALDLIRTDGGTQARYEIDHDAVQQYRERWLAGDKFPPPTVFYDGATYWLGDGFHRFWCAKEAELIEMDVDVRQGSLDDAIECGLKANRDHGLRLKPADYKKIVGMILARPQWADKSTKWIAEEFNLSQSTVAKYREELSTSRAGCSTVVGRDGASRPSTKPPKTTAHAVKEMLDAGQVQAKDVAAIAAKPAALQEKAADLVRAGETKTLTEAMKIVESDLMDDDGKELPKKLKPVWEDRERLRELSDQLNGVIKGLKKLHNQPILGFCDQDKCLSYLQTILTILKNGLPSTVCGKCHGDGCYHAPCFGHGFLPKKAS